MSSGYVRVSRESIPGNETNAPTLSTKKLFPRLINFGLNPNVAHLNRDDELIGTDEPVPVQPEAFAPTWDMEHRMYPDALGFDLAWLLGDPVTTAGDGTITDPDAVAIPVGAYRHVWTAPFGPAGSSPMTAEITSAWKDQSFFAKTKGATPQSLELSTPETGGCRIKMTGPALYVVKIADPSLSPAYEADTVLAFNRAYVTIGSWLASTADPDDLTLTIENSLEPKSPFGAGSLFPSKMYKGNTPITVGFAMPKELIAAADWDALIAATGFAVKIKWATTQIIASAYPYKFFAQSGNAQYTQGGPDALVNARRIGGAFTGKFTRTGGTASSTFTLVNATASYA